MRVYRVTDNDGHGPQDSGLTYTYMAAVLEAVNLGLEEPLSEEESNAHPGIASRYDGLGAKLHPDLRFGCAELGDLRRWFHSPAGCRAMTAEGAIIATFEVPEACVIVGRHRVLFILRAARLINTKPALITNMVTRALTWGPAAGAPVAMV
ncbi:hypothetical protein [Rhizobium laguerreae]|uniref:Uncharacterized protein n=1 Tax=Rhizobium laguerreae TaxID=1076926 RepID=A0A7Y2W524_9HYPH|nr:hypothetical protein [Rhizobium laguerreae]NNH63693.1 hypothetical protein [Rhizobium laguerreae]